jgi:hypothetical protein
VDYELVSKEPRGSLPRASLWLFRPRGGFKTGKSYVFTTRRTHGLGGEERGVGVTVSVTVSDQAAVSPAGPVALKVDEPTTGFVGIAAGGSCGKSFIALRLPIAMDLPEGLKAFRDQLYFETIVDGTDRWSPSDSICTPIVPGTSWRGKGVDLLFSGCSDTEGLAAGRHTVEMRATLPGTDVSAVTSKTEVELRCPP